MLIKLQTSLMLIFTFELFVEISSPISPLALFVLTSFHSLPEMSKYSIVAFLEANSSPTPFCALAFSDHAVLHVLSPSTANLVLTAHPRIIMVDQIHPLRLSKGHFFIFLSQGNHFPFVPPTSPDQAALLRHPDNPTHWPLKATLFPFCTPNFPRSGHTILISSTCFHPFNTIRMIL